MERRTLPPPLTPVEDAHLAFEHFGVRNANNLAGDLGGPCWFAHRARHSVLADRVYC
jgi:hypothetical protein